MKFLHESLPQRVHFASGEAAVAVASEIDRLRAQRVMVIASDRELELADRVTLTLGEKVAVRHTEVVMHVPVEVAARARTRAKELGIDALVAVGGGSTTGLAKAIALTSGLPIIAVPTTYAGSEATSVWGLTEGGQKTVGNDPHVLPVAIVYDATLTLSLPVELSVASGLNAVAHCVDSMWAPKANPINAALAAEGIRALTLGLPRVARAPSDIEGREQALVGAYLAAAAFASAGSGLHHKICHTLGGKYNLPHAETHAVVLPYVLAMNVRGAPDAEQRMATAFAATSALTGLLALKTALGAPRALRDYGLRDTDLDAAADAILPSVPPTNPVPVTKDLLVALLRAAWEGSAPR